MRCILSIGMTVRLSRESSRADMKLQTKIRLRLGIFCYTFLQSSLLTPSAACQAHPYDNRKACLPA